MLYFIPFAGCRIFSKRIPVQTINLNDSDATQLEFQFRSPGICKWNRTEYSVIGNDWEYIDGNPGNIAARRISFYDKKLQVNEFKGLSKQQSLRRLEQKDESSFLASCCKTHVLKGKYFDTHILKCQYIDIIMSFILMSSKIPSLTLMTVTRKPRQMLPLVLGNQFPHSRTKIFLFFYRSAAPSCFLHRFLASY